MSGGGSATTGYRYYMGQQLAVCVGPADAFTKLTVGDAIAWEGEVTDNGSIFIDKPGLFGGDSGQGGLVGQLDVAFGGPTQMQNDYLQSVISGLLPAYRKKFCLIWRGGQICSNNPYIKNWKPRVRKILKGWANDTVWYPEKAIINGNRMNPAHIIYRVLTDRRIGMGKPTTRLDDTAFRAFADTLYAEGFGLSFKWTRQTSAKDFVKMVLDHVGGVLGYRLDNGQYVPKLARADYVVADLPSYGPETIMSMDSFQRQAWGETVNDVTIVYRDSATGNDVPISDQNQSNIRAQKEVISQTMSYPGIRDAELARIVLQRDLNVMSTPLAKMRFTANRAFALRKAGEVVKITWPERSVVDLVIRLLSVKKGILTDGRITVEAVEDIFGLPASSNLNSQAGGWVSPRTDPVDPMLYKVGEAHYFDVARVVGDASAQDLPADAGYVSVLVGRPSGDTYDFELWTRTGSNEFMSRDRDNPCPTALLSSGLSITGLTATLTGGVDLTGVLTGSWCYVGDEVCRVDSIDLTTMAITFARGCLDTVPIEHSAGTQIFFADGYTGQDRTQWVTGEGVDAKMTPRTGRGELLLASATTHSQTIAGRQARPYPPGQFAINGASYPSSATFPLTITWSHRDRTQQTAGIIDTSAGNIGPEVGVTYTLELRDSSGTLIDGQVGITGTTATLTGTLSDTYTVSLKSVRAGLDSWQSHQWALTASP